MWTVVIAAVFGGLFIHAVNAAAPASGSSSTTAVASILGVLQPFAGLVLLLACVGALFSLTR
jgi:hypothetical protein